MGNGEADSISVRGEGYKANNDGNGACGDEHSVGTMVVAANVMIVFGLMVVMVMVMIAIRLLMVVTAVIIIVVVFMVVVFMVAYSLLKKEKYNWRYTW